MSFMKNHDWKRTLKNIAVSLAIPVGIFVIFGILSGGRTATMRMFTTTVRQSTVPIIICWGLMMNMSVGMVNFSAGAMMLLAGIVGGNLAKSTGTGVPGLIVMCLLVTVVLGAITGLLYNAIRVPAMVLTIGTLMVWESAPNVPYPDGVTLSPDLTVLAQSPWCFIVLGVMLVIFHFVFNKTSFGHNLMAIGNNQAIANSVGLNIDKIKLLSFIIGSVFLGVAAALNVSVAGTQRNVASMGSMQLMMDGFMGMFMAMFLSRYCNMSVAVIIGAFSMKMLSNGFVAMGFSSTAQDIVQGLLLLVLLTISANAGIIELRRANKAFKEAANKERLGNTA